jgi:transcriptional/translational regulatory protein YebC/TACO1
VSLLRGNIHSVSKWLAGNGWKVVTSESGYIPKNFCSLSDEQREEVGEFLEILDDHDDACRIWVALE